MKKILIVCVLMFAFSSIYADSVMVFVQGGTFKMGSPESEKDSNDSERPVHSVTLDSFYIGKYEVTQKEWTEVMGNNPSGFKGDNLPAETVNWYEAVDFCNKKSQKEGLTPCYMINGKNVTCNWNANGYRLPTEAEWEYAARGGNKSRSYKYSGSNDIDTVVWYFGNSGSETHPVGTKNSNELGIHDMSGNVYEWCWDWYGNYSNNAEKNPVGPDSGSFRVLRGGSWDYFAQRCRSANRRYIPGHGDGRGLRLARVP